MTAPLAPGALRIVIATDTGRRVVSVDIKSTRPVGLGRLFIGRPAAEAPALAARLFGLCGFSHAAAARLAIAAARGAQPDPSQAAAIALGLAGPLREALAASRELILAESEGRFPAPRAARPARCRRRGLRPAQRWRADGGQLLRCDYG